MFRYHNIHAIRPQRLTLVLSSVLCLSAIALVPGVFTSSKAAAANASNSEAAAAKVSPWRSLGGTLTSGPAAVSWGLGREDVFVRGADNRLWHKWYDVQRSGSKWSGWESLGGALTSDPDAASYNPGELDVFVRGTDGYLWHKWYPKSVNPPQGGWSQWERLGTLQIVGGPAVVAWTGTYPNNYQREAVFVRGTDNHMYAAVQLGDFSPSWVGWQPLGGVLSSDPDATVYEPGDRLDVFVRGGSALWKGEWTAASDGTLTGGFNTALGGGLKSGPGVSAEYMVTTGYGMDEDVFVQGNDGRLWHRGWHPRLGVYWSNWEALGGALSSSPDVAYPGGTTITDDHRPGVDVFVRGSNKALYYLNYYNA